MAPVRLVKACAILLVYIASGCHETFAKCKPRKDACPSDWSLWGGSCYKAIATKLKWLAARAECKRIGGEMATPNSLDESLFISSLAPNIWINCNDMDTEGKWNCTDGLTEIQYRNWLKPDPNDQGGEDCVYMPNRKGNWLDVSCDSQQHQAVCKQPIQQNTIMGLQRDL